MYKTQPQMQLSNLKSYYHRRVQCSVDACPGSGCETENPNSLVQLPKTAIAVSDDIAVFGDIVPCPIAENGDILENSVNT